MRLFGLLGAFQLKVLTAIAIALRNKILEASEEVPRTALRNPLDQGFTGLSTPPQKRANWPAAAPSGPDTWKRLHL